MIPALIALITFLFLGGPSEIFYVDNLEKGIKKYVVEKERKKEILSEIKNTKTIFKSFEKERKKDYKEFLNLYAEKQTTPDELHSYFEDLQSKRTDIQNILVDQRILIFEKIKSDEWQQIIESSVTVAEKRIATVEKKASKGKEAFAKTKKQIEIFSLSVGQKHNLLKGLEDIISSINTLESTLLSMNSRQNEILANKSSGKSELLEVVDMDNRYRSPVIESLIDFHNLAKENCSDEEWSQLMKAFLKDLQMSTR